MKTYIKTYDTQGRLAGMKEFIPGVYIKLNEEIFIATKDSNGDYFINNLPITAGKSVMEVYGWNGSSIGIDEVLFHNYGDTSKNNATHTSKFIVRVEDVLAFNDSKKYLSLTWDDPKNPSEFKYLALTFKDVQQNTYVTAQRADGEYSDLKMEFDDKTNTATVYLNDNTVIDLGYNNRYSQENYDPSLRYDRNLEGIALNEVVGDEGVNWVGEMNPSYDPNKETGEDNWPYLPIDENANGVVSQESGWHAGIIVKP